MDDTQRLFLAMETIAKLSREKEELRRELVIVNENYEGLQEENDHIQHVYQDEHCDLLKMKEGITEIGHFIKNKFWSYVDENGIKQYTETVRDLLKMLYQVQGGRDL